MIYDLDGMLPERAFQRDARGQIKPQGGGGPSAPTNQNVTTTSIPEYARPYVEKMLGKAYDYTDSDKNPFQPYTGQRTAAFTPMQAQAMQNVAGMQTSGQITDASNLAYTAGQQGLGAQQAAAGLQNTALGYGAQAAEMAPQAQQYGAQAADIGQIGMGYGAQGAGIGARGVSAAEQGFGAGDAYRQQATSAEAMGQYMSPYMQNVVDVQQKEAVRQADIARQSNQAQAVKSGAFGGSRSAIVEAEGQRNLQDRLANIQATGSQSAYDKAQQAQQFASTTGIQGLQAGYQGLQTGLQGTAQGMQGAQVGIQGQQAGMQGLGQAGQLYGLGMQGVQTATGAGQYGLQGAGLAGQAAGTLGQLGQQEFGQQQAITDAQMRAGTMQRQEEQQGLDQLYQQFMAEQNYPMEQLGQFSNILRGLPLNQYSQSQYQNPSGLSQAVGAGTALYGAYQMGRKKGGAIKENSGGLATLGMYNAMKKGSR
jgi:hypothetical protein